MPKLASTALLVTTMLAAVHGAPGGQGADREGGQQESAQPARFAGTWVGTQSWALDNPPPGASRDQPVTLTLEVVDGKVVGTMVPFLGGEDGATIVDSVIVGDELRATAVVGRARPQAAGRRPSTDAQGAPSRVEGRGGGPAGWKEPIRVAFVFRTGGMNVSGTADVRMGDVPWLKFKYDLGKKRSRY